jgi:hypothetical protein
VINPTHLEWSIAPGFEETWGRVYVCSFDISDLKRTEEQLKIYQEPPEGYGGDVRTSLARKSNTVRP